MLELSEAKEGLAMEADRVVVGWLVATVECRVCSHRHIAVYPEDIDEEDNQECSKCHAMSAEPIEYHGPES